MNDSLVNVFTVFVMGVGLAFAFLEFVRWLPFDDYFKIILMVVVPIPLFCIGLVMVFLGPESYREAAIEQASPASLLKSFMSGAFWAVVILGLLHSFLVMRDEE